MSNWVENKNGENYKKTLYWYNKIKNNIDKYKYYYIFNFSPKYNNYERNVYLAIQYQSSMGFEVRTETDLRTLCKIEGINRYIDLTYTDYCMSYNIDGELSLFEKYQLMNKQKNFPYSWKVNKDI